MDNFQLKKIIYGVIAVVVIEAGIALSQGTLFSVNADKLVMVQSPMGNITTHIDPGIKLMNFGNFTELVRSFIYFFSAMNDQGKDDGNKGKKPIKDMTANRSIEVRWYDGAAEIGKRPFVPSILMGNDGSPSGNPAAMNFMDLMMTKTTRDLHMDVFGRNSEESVVKIKKEDKK
jgi:hypothetical protein